MEEKLVPFDFTQGNYHHLNSLEALHTSGNSLFCDLQSALCLIRPEPFDSTGHGGVALRLGRGRWS